MTVCITAVGPTLDAALDPTFGRARYFLFVNPETGAVEAHENAPGAHGAGVQAAQLLADRRVDALITGNVGPNALGGLQSAGIPAFPCPAGSAEEALARYRRGELSATAAPTQAKHGGGQ